MDEHTSIRERYHDLRQHMCESMAGLGDKKKIRRLISKTLEAAEGYLDDCAQQDDSPHHSDIIRQLEAISKASLALQNAIGSADRETHQALEGQMGLLTLSAMEDSPLFEAADWFQRNYIHWLRANELEYGDDSFDLWSKEQYRSVSKWLRRTDGLGKLAHLMAERLAEAAGVTVEQPDKGGRGSLRTGLGASAKLEMAISCYWHFIDAGLKPTSTVTGMFATYVGWVYEIATGIAGDDEGAGLETPVKTACRLVSRMLDAEKRVAEAESIFLAAHDDPSTPPNKLSELQDAVENAGNEHFEAEKAYEQRTGRLLG